MEHEYRKASGAAPQPWQANQQVAQTNSPHSLGMLHQDGRLESFGAPALQAGNSLPPPQGLVSLLQIAHDEMDRLTTRLNALYGQLEPIYQPIPEGLGQKAQDTAEPSALTTLRYLIGRIEGAVADIETLSNGLRV